MDETTMEPRTRTRAEATITVQSSEATPFDQTAGPKLMDIRLHETFTGDIDGESPALQVLRDDKSGSFPDRGQVIFRGCAARVALKATWLKPYAAPAESRWAWPSRFRRTMLSSAISRANATRSVTRNSYWPPSLLRSRSSEAQ
jgi:hypothetical protein